MLQLINAVHNFSILNPSLYFGSLLVLLLIVLRGWYRLGSLNALVLVSPAPHSAPVRPRVTLYRKGLSLVLQLTGLLILASVEVRSDSIALILAAKVT